MRPSSSTSRSSAAAAALAAALLLALSGSAAALCLPPVFEGGRRLHPVGSARVMSLALLLRQHEVCWRAPRAPDERRIFLVGNSAVFGFPLPVEETAWGILNPRLGEADPPAHVFNLGFVFSYQLKEALILHEALAYGPDAIVHGVTLDDFIHRAPIRWPQLATFFETNRSALAELADAGASGLGEPLSRYRELQGEADPPSEAFGLLRQAGLLLRAGLEANARWLLRDVLLSPALVPRPEPEVDPPRDRYDCGERRAWFEEHFQGWRDWNVLAYLEQVQRETGARVLVVNWPVAHEPRGACYNARYPASDLAAYNAWLAEETHARGLRYLDLHDLLPARDFVDSLHPNARGQYRVASRVREELLALARRAEVGSVRARGAGSAP
jgi:hypothetical protein